MNESCKTITGECHCSRVGFEITAAPEQLVDCNCSICRRIGALWGHIRPDEFRRRGSGETIAYVHGDKTLAIHSCGHCGCTTHWMPLQDGQERMAVNFRMCKPQVVSGFRIRRFDGAHSWTFIDDEE